MSFISSARVFRGGFGAAKKQNIIIQNNVYVSAVHAQWTALASAEAAPLKLKLHMSVHHRHCCLGIKIGIQSVKDPL